MIYQTFELTPITINLIPEVTNGRDWTVDEVEQSATHIKCNDGEIELINFNVKPNTLYQYSYEVEEIFDGYLKISAGGDNSQPQVTTAGVKTGVLTTTTNTPLKFFSNANTTISNLTLKIINNSTDDDLETRTIVYNEGTNKWVSFRSYIPDSGVSLFTDLFTFKEGKTYIHSDRVNRNNFYGVKYDTKVKWQMSSKGVKTFESIAVHSNKVIGTTEDGIETQLGHVSDLIKEDFITKEGIHYANFLRDKFTDIIDGDRLKGRYIVIEFEDKCGKKLHIFKTVVKSNISTINE